MGRGYTVAFDTPLSDIWQRLHPPERPERHFEVASPEGRTFTICGKCGRWVVRQRWTKDVDVCDHMIATT